MKQVLTETHLKRRIEIPPQVIFKQPYVGLSWITDHGRANNLGHYVAYHVIQNVDKSHLD